MAVGFAGFAEASRPATKWRVACSALCLADSIALGSATKAMDAANIVDQLRQERAQVEAAIVSLERLVRSRHSRRGRPPGSKNKPKQPRETAAAPGPQPREIDCSTLGLPNWRVFSNAK